jgi:hypothetical protein
LYPRASVIKGKEKEEGMGMGLEGREGEDRRDGEGGKRSKEG